MTPAAGAWGAGRHGSTDDPAAADGGRVRSGEADSRRAAARASCLHGQHQSAAQGRQHIQRKGRPLSTSAAWSLNLCGCQIYACAVDGVLNVCDTFGAQLQDFCSSEESPQASHQAQMSCAGRRSGARCAIRGQQVGTAASCAQVRASQHSPCQAYACHSAPTLLDRLCIGLQTACLQFSTLQH